MTDLGYNVLKLYQYLKLFNVISSYDMLCHLNLFGNTLLNSQELDSRKPVEFTSNDLRILIGDVLES